MVAVVHECAPGAFMFLRGSVLRNGMFLVFCELRVLDQNDKGGQEWKSHFYEVNVDRVSETIKKKTIKCVHMLAKCDGIVCWCEREQEEFDVLLFVHCL